MERAEQICFFVEKHPNLGSFFSPATIIPMYRGADIIKIKYKMEGEDDGGVSFVFVILTRGKTVARSSPTMGSNGELFVERWISRADEGLYALPFELDEIFGGVEIFEEDNWMRAAMNCEEWIYKDFRCRKRL